MKVSADPGAPPAARGSGDGPRGVRGGPLRHQLAVHSPLPVAAALGGMVTALRGGDPRPRLRDRLRAELSADAVVLCDSGTHALQLAIRAARTLRGTDGQRIAIPAFSCFDLATAAIGSGGELLLYDVDPGTLAPDQDSLERALQAGAGVVVVAPLYGIPAPWEELERLCDRYGATLIEDAAQGFGARWRGRPLGTLGAISVLSFGRGKGWTGGKGGALLLRGAAARVDLASLEPAHAAAFREDAATGVASALQAVLGRPSLYGIPRAIPWLRLGETVYHPPTQAREMPRAAAAILERTRREAERETARRRDNAAALLAGLGPSASAIAVPVGAEPGYLRLPLRLRGGMRAFGNDRRASRLGIAPSYPAPLDALAPLRARLAGTDATPGAAELAKSLITLPTHSLLLPAEIAAILELVNGAAGK